MLEHDPPRPACQGCHHACPPGIDLGTYRWARIGGHAPRLANLVAQAPGLRRIVARLAGMAPGRPLPRFAARRFSRQFEPRARGRVPVILWPDTLHDHFDPGPLDAAVEVLEDAGFRVLGPHGPVCCGRALHDRGRHDEARRLWERTFRRLGTHLARRTPIVGLEPGCVAAFRDQLPGLFPGDARARRLARQARTLPELLVEHGYDPPRVHARALVHGRCRGQEVTGLEAERRLLEQMEMEVALALPDALLPAARAEPDATIVVADGFGCRAQLRRDAGRHARHVACVLARALRDREAPPRARHR